MARRAAGNKRMRVRSKRLDQLDETKLALALWLMAKDMAAEPASDDAVVLADTTPDNPSEPEAA